jgi:hypothetical protein
VRVQGFHLFVTFIESSLLVRTHNTGVNKEHEWCIAGAGFQPVALPASCNLFVLSIHYETNAVKITRRRLSFPVVSCSV